MSDSDNNRDSILSMATIAAADNSDGKVKGKNEENARIRFVQRDEKFNRIVLSVDILLNATGNVPIMKKRKWTVDQEKQLSWVIRFIHKYLKLDSDEKLVGFEK